MIENNIYFFMNNYGTHFDDENFVSSVIAGMIVKILYENEYSILLLLYSVQ